MNQQPSPPDAPATARDPDVIIAGNFEHRSLADVAQQRLEGLGIAADSMYHFALNAPGQHDLTPVGGDEDEDAGAEDADRTALIGAGVGAALGLGVAVAAAPVLGAAIVLGAVGAGAYGGSLYGATSGTNPDPDKQTGDVRLRPAGAVLAVRVDPDADEAHIIDALHESGARVVERAAGTWRDGVWTDFDPRTKPEVVAPLVKQA